MNDEEIVMPKKIDFKLGDRNYIIKRLSITQERDLLRFFSKTVLSSQDILKKIAEKTKDNTSNIQDVHNIIELLDVPDLCKLIGIILNEKDIDFLISNIDSAYISQLIADVMECNKTKFEMLKKNIPRITQYVVQLLQKEKTN